MKKDKILLIDGYNFIYRAKINFFQKKTLESSEEKTDYTDYTLIYNFFRNLRALIELHTPNKVFFVLEGHPQFRYDIYSDYKANRIIKRANQTEAQEKDTESFNFQKRILLDLLKALPITTVKADNYECDDVINTLAEDLKDEEVIIVSNDDDYTQLLQKNYQNLSIYNAHKKQYAVNPSYPFLQYKILTGDKSDNIPRILTDGKAKKILENTEKFEEFMSIEENRSLFNINRQLIEFRMIPMEELIFEEGNSNFDKLKQEFEFMDFKTMIEENYWNKFCETFKRLGTL